jgi:hypothetical protein
VRAIGALPRSNLSRWLIATTCGRAPGPARQPSTTCCASQRAARPLTSASAAGPKRGCAATCAATSASRCQSCGRSGPSAAAAATSAVVAAAGGGPGRSATNWARSSSSLICGRSASAKASRIQPPAWRSMRIAAHHSDWPCAVRAGQVA